MGGCVSKEKLRAVEEKLGAAESVVVVDESASEEVVEEENER